MSGGEKKKKAGDRSHGWEEAGGEFYQESYPAATIEEFQRVVKRDPSKIATLLPSKKSRVATTTAKRIKQEPRTLRTVRRKTNTRRLQEQGTCQNTGRRFSATIQDAAVAMLPDLSENLSNEERTWEDIMQIKSMPISMHQKKQIKIELQSATKLRLQGFEMLKWQRRKAWQHFKIKLKETYSKMELWSVSLRCIGGNFGAGIVSFFLFIKWILFLNVLLFSIIAAFLILPTFLLEPPKTEICTTNLTSDAYCCAELYQNKSRKVRTLTDFFQSSELFEYSPLFYGAYSSGTAEVPNIRYNFSLAYMGVMMAIFIVSLLSMARIVVRGYRRRIVETEGQLYRYCNTVFAGWDYRINNEKASSSKRRALTSELKCFLRSERKESRFTEEKFKLILYRISSNTVVLGILCSCWLLVFYDLGLSFDFTTDVLDQLTNEFSPYALIVALNMFMPIVFRSLQSLEGHEITFAAKLALLRSAALRVTTLGALLANFWVRVSGEVEDGECANATRPLCWETFVGQQFLKLYVTDVAAQFLVTFLVNFPRSVLARNSENKFLRYVGRQEFDLARHALDMVYLQTVCWLGAFFTPFLPLVAVVGSFILFYVKKFACLVNCSPSKRVYSASKSYFLFIVMLLIGFGLTTVPVGYSVLRMSPSKACGPFKELDSAWNIVTATYYELPTWMQNTLALAGTAYFALPTIVILALLLYYYHAVANANKDMVNVLKNQLVLEGHDKQFLLDRLSAFIKQQQQEQGKYQHADNELPN